MSDDDRIRAYLRRRADVAVPDDLRWPAAESEPRRRWAIRSVGAWGRLAAAGLVMVVVVVVASLSQTTPTGPGRASTPPASSSALPTPTGPAHPSTPSASSSALPTGQPSNVPLGSVQIPFVDRAMEVTIVGEPGIVVAWRAATERDLREIAWADADIALGRLSDRDLVLAWTGTVCDVTATLTVAPGRLVVTPVPRQGCDASAVGRGIVLTFAEPTDPNAITVELGDTILLPEGS